MVKLVQNINNSCTQKPAQCVCGKDKFIKFQIGWICENCQRYYAPDLSKYMFIKGKNNSFKRF
jgi:hypothetical protein